MFGYSFYREVLFFDTGSGKAVSVSFGEPGYSEETARNLQGDILESQRKYYGGYIHVGKRVSAYQANRWKDCFWTEAATAPWTRMEAGYSSSLTATIPDCSCTITERSSDRRKPLRSRGRRCRNGEGRRAGGLREQKGLWTSAHNTKCGMPGRECCCPG